MFTEPCKRSTAITLAAGLVLALVGCKKQEAAAPAAVRPEPPAAKPVPAPPPAQRAVAKTGAPAADAGVTAAPRALAVRTGQRPECKEPEPILSEKGRKWFSDRDRRSLPKPLSWGVVWYLRGPDGKETLPQADGHDVGLPRGSDVVDSNYFAGLLPNRTAGILAGGAARFVAVNERWSHKADGFETVWLGTLSDHCMPVAANDETLLFSIKLSDRAAVQALVERAEKLTDYSVQYYGEGDAVMPKEMLKTLSKKDKKIREAIAVRVRTVKLPWDGTVLDEGPRMPYSEFAGWSIDTFDEQPETPVALSIAGHADINAAWFISREGKIVASVPSPCKDHELAVWTTRTENGRMRVRFTERDDRRMECKRDEAERVERILNDAERPAPARTGGRD